MNNGHIRRLHWWLESTVNGFIVPECDTAKILCRKRYLPMVEEIVAQNVGQPDDAHIQTPVTFNGITYGENDIDILQLALNKVEQECYGTSITRLLLGGFYPGNYMSTCALCTNKFIGQKRGVVCIPCAALRVPALS